uniref:Uncharacterized protein n=1 Tax=Arundo donax TaxID=35708 RepID=A0A0A8ZQE7_ARUDO
MSNVTRLVPDFQLILLPRSCSNA